MKQRLFSYLVLAIMTMPLALFAQKSLTYYLPKAKEYNTAIPTPEAVLGYQVGEWHVSHDHLVKYMYALAEASERVQVVEYARSHEHRPLLHLIVTSPSNQSKLEEIREQHLALSDPSKSASMEVKNMPVVVYQGYSVHGNESSGANAALLMAYHLAAAQGKAINETLENAVILLDPCMNPDGLNRFASWVNTHKSKTLDPVSASREHNEVWPSGRTNHYWFDLNRDWLLVQHPESVGRITQFHRWKPNILTDHHEMGTNSTFFFQPGIPSRTHPLTPSLNQELTGEIARYHAKALDGIGSLYYSKESFDDFYYGKGSTYPDVNGCIGILFEQASSRGHLQESQHGLLDFPFTIRNQLQTSLSTVEAATAMRVKLLEYQKGFYKEAKEMASRDKAKAYVVGDKGDPARLKHFTDLLTIHQVDFFRPESTISTPKKSFSENHSIVIPFNQPQYQLIKAMFETRSDFKDSLFYDVSTFTLPLAFNLAYAELNSVPNRSTGKVPMKNQVIGGKSNYAYLLEWKDYYTPKSLYTLLKKGIRVKVANQPFVATVDGKSKQFVRGALLIAVEQGGYTADGLYALLKEIAKEGMHPIYSVNSGLTDDGVDLGSPSFSSLRDPAVLLVVGEGVTSYDAGEIWHLLDTRYQIPVTIVDAYRLGKIDLKRYKTIIMPDGGYGSITGAGVGKLRTWVGEGGTLVALRGATRWVAGRGLATVSFKAKQDNSKKAAGLIRKSYGNHDNDKGAQYIGGAIFETRMDLTHPICYGYSSNELPVFHRGTAFMEWTKNQYATPVRYSLNPLLSGYISSENEQVMSNSAAVVVGRNGRGRVICMGMNPNFRAFWYGTNKLFMNAIFFGHTIDAGASETLIKK